MIVNPQWCTPCKEIPLTNTMLAHPVRIGYVESDIDGAAGR